MSRHEQKIDTRCRSRYAAGTRCSLYANPPLLPVLRQGSRTSARSGTRAGPVIDESIMM